MVNLYPLNELYRSLIDLYNSAESDEEQHSILLQIEQVEGVIEEQIDQLHRAWRNLSVMAAGVRSEYERIKAYVQLLDKQEDGIKRLLLETMRRNAMLKVDTTIGQLRVQTNSQATVIVECDPKTLPEQYRVVIPIQYEPDKKALAEDWKKVTDRISELEKEFYNAKAKGQVEGDFDLYSADIQARTELGYPLPVIVNRGVHLRAK
jgi:hypothetical protein